MFIFHLSRIILAMAIIFPIYMTLDVIREVESMNNKSYKCWYFIMFFVWVLVLLQCLDNWYIYMM